VAPPGLSTPLGVLDITTQINFADDLSSIDIAERTPALNDNGDIAFVSATQTTTGSGGAIFVRRAGDALLTPVIRLGGAYGGRHLPGARAAGDEQRRHPGLPRLRGRAQPDRRGLRAARHDAVAVDPGRRITRSVPGVVQGRFPGAVRRRRRPERRWGRRLHRR